MSKFKGITIHESGPLLIYWGTLKGWIGTGIIGGGYPEFRGTCHNVGSSEDVLIPGEFL